MTCCAYCEREATTTIVSNPERVCLEHALEFWTGLLAYARDRRRDPCMKYEGFCTCTACEELRQFRLQPVATNDAAPSVQERDRFPVYLAS